MPIPEVPPQPITQQPETFREIDKSTIGMSVYSTFSQLATVVVHICICHVAECGPESAGGASKPVSLLESWSKSGKTLDADAVSVARTRLVNYHHDYGGLVAWPLY